MLEYINDIRTFNPELFHFMRPQWLWAFVPAAFVAVLVVFASNENKKWKTIISPELRPFMFTKDKRSAIIFPILAFLFISMISIFGVAGPTWSKVEVPGSKSEAVLMVALDVSLSMMAEDIQPNRLERAKFKIEDLLDANPGSRVGLYAFAGTPHTVVPFCSDYSLITHHLAPLSPGIMPVQGSNLREMMLMVDSVMRKIKAPSILLLVTDVPEEDDLSVLTAFVESTPHKVELLVMGTPQGATVPKNRNKTPLKDSSGEIVISKLNTSVLIRLEQHEKIHVNTLTLDNSDMEALADNIRENLDYQDDNENSDEQWKDMGYVSVILLALFFPFWFRKGWMIQYGWIPLFILLMPSCTERAETWEDLWYTKDFQGQQLYDEEAFDDAGNTFTSAFHQGVAYYKAGNFDAASQSFESDSSVNSLYNLSMAYSQLGRYDDALRVITLASEKEPNNMMLQKAKEQTEVSKHIIDSLQNAGNVILLEQKTEDEKSPLKEIKPKTKDEELSSDNEVEDLPEDGERITDEVETDMRKGEELEEVPEDFESGEGSSPQKILLRAISDEPGEFLRRRFKYQSKTHYSTIETPQQTW